MTKTPAPKIKQLFIIGLTYAEEFAIHNKLLESQTLNEVLKGFQNYDNVIDPLERGLRMKRNF